MARVSGPLMSMDASGTIAGAVTFSKWKGRPYVRRHTIPKNPQAPLQVGMRSMMAFLAPEWSGIYNGNHPSWLLFAEAQRISTFNAFIQENLRNWRHFLAPSDEHPRNPVSTPPGAPTLAVVGGVRLIDLEIGAGIPAPTGGYIVMTDIATILVEGLDKVKAVIGPLPDPRLISLNAVTGTTVFCIVRGFNVDGVIGPQSPERDDLIL